MTQTILLCDDHVLVLQTLEAFIQTHLPSAQIISTESFDLFTDTLKDENSIDLAIIDFHMPGINGMNSINQLINNVTNVPIAIISGLASNAEILQFIKLGAVGFLPKTMSGNGLVNAINLMLCGEVYVPSFVALEDKKNNLIVDSEPQLSQREKDVLKKLHLGYQNKEIARLLYIEEVTVKVYVSRLCKIFGAKNRTAVVVAALSKGLL